jgi:hypothetical protein
MRRLIVIAIVLLGLLGLVAINQFLGQTLPFETISQSNGTGDLGLNYGEKAPALMIIAKPEEIDALAKTVLAGRTDLLSSLRQKDYARAFVVMVFEGLKPSPNFVINIQRVALRGDQVTIWAEFRVPGPVIGGTSVFPSFASPYHIVTVARDGIGAKQVRFVLMDGLTPVAETDHFIP